MASSLEVMVALKASNELYVTKANLHCRIKEFEDGGLDLVHLRQKRFPKGTDYMLEVKEVRGM